MKTHLYNENKTDKQKVNNKKNFFIIPYIKNISEQFNHITEKFGFRLSCACNNKLNKIIKTGKDQLEHMKQNEVVYKITCQDCDATYIGQTKRKLGTRVGKHRADIRKRSGSPSVILNHRIKKQHEFDLSKTEILDKKSSYKKRLISEMIHIKRHNTALNKQSDTKLLPESYLPLLNPFPPKLPVFYFPHVFLSLLSRIILVYIKHNNSSHQC